MAGVKTIQGRLPKLRKVLKLGLILYRLAPSSIYTRDFATKQEVNEENFVIILSHLCLSLLLPSKCVCTLGTILTEAKEGVRSTGTGIVSGCGRA